VPPWHQNIIAEKQVHKNLLSKQLVIHLEKVKRISLGNVYTKKILTSGRRKHINDDRAIGDDLYHNGLGD
jgi:hypothetical protein